MTTTVQQSGTRVTVIIECGDSNEAERVAAELAAEVNSGKFKTRSMQRREADDNAALKPGERIPNSNPPREVRPDPMQERYEASRDAPKARKPAKE
jgi:hypothetical protein